jgi:hypothetical protein
MNGLPEKNLKFRGKILSVCQPSVPRTQQPLCLTFAKTSLKITRPVLDRLHDSSKVKALGFMLYALCSMLYALCSMLYALCSKLNALCFILYLAQCAKSLEYFRQ